MRYRRLGSSNLQVSELCLGAMMFADQTDATAAADIVAIARERGVNFVDTADVYTRGASERMLGALIRADRDDWIVATKLGNPMSRKPNEGRYNLLNRAPEVEIVPACASYGLGVVPYSPVARGVLTGKYVPEQAPPEGTRVARGDKRVMETEWRPESLAIAQTLKERLADRAHSLLHFAVAWVLANPLVSSVIAGPRTAAQWRDYFDALDVTVTEADEAMVDALVPPGHASTHGYHDPQYPFFGRTRR